MNKVIPWFAVGKRDESTTHEFIRDLSERIEGRVQISTDGWGPYRTAIPRFFGARADFEQIIKTYAEAPDEHRYSPPKVRTIDHVWIQGAPRTDLVSTSHVERHNLSVRTSLRRFTRLSIGFSRKVENLRAAVAVYVMWYNYVRMHRTLRVTPMMAAGIEKSFWTMDQLLPGSN